jgi:hypothetical protein
LKKSHSGNIQQNMDDVVVLAISSSRSDPIQRRKWRRLREMYMYSAPTTPPSRSSEIWWSGRWDRQHDGVVSMVESMLRQGFACLRGGRRTEKGDFRKKTAASRELGLHVPIRSAPFYSRLARFHKPNVLCTLALHSRRMESIDQIRGSYAPLVSGRERSSA